MCVSGDVTEGVTVKSNDALMVMGAPEPAKAEDQLKRDTDQAKPLDAIREKSKALLEEYRRRRPDIFYRGTD